MIHVKIEKQQCPQRSLLKGKIDFALGGDEDTFVNSLNSIDSIEKLLFSLKIEKENGIETNEQTNKRKKKRKPCDMSKHLS